MKFQLEITDRPIDESSLVNSRSMSSGMGAAVYFSGVVRDVENKNPIAALEYEAFRQMAEHQFKLIFEKVGQQWPIESIRLVHRIGRIEVGQASLWVEVIAPHRAEAFAACQ